MDTGSFLLYLLITAGSPGPNNIMAMNFGTRLGFRRSLSFVFGVWAGATVLALVAAFLGQALFAYLPGIHGIMKWVGITYLLWLAWHTFKAGSPEDPESLTGAGFSRGLILQFINIKVILYSITSMSSFVLPYYQDPLPISFWAFVMGFFVLFCTMAWSAFGSAFRSLFQKHYQVLNTVMALLLVYCAWTLY